MVSHLEQGDKGFLKFLRGECKTQEIAHKFQILRASRIQSKPKQVLKRGLAVYCALGELPAKSAGRACFFKVWWQYNLPLVSSVPAHQTRCTDIQAALQIPCHTETHDSPCNSLVFKTGPACINILWTPAL